jgi:hypothetical protein
LVLYVALAEGDRVDAYHLGTDGLLPDKPFSSINMQNPRRLLVSDGILFIAGRNQIFSVLLGADGALPQSPTSATLERIDMEAIEMITANGKLYAAVSGFNSVEAYPIDANGRLPESPSSFGTGTSLSDYRTLALSGNFLYAGARSTARVDVFLLKAGGELPDEPEPQEPDIFAALPDDIVIRDGILYLTSGSDAAVQGYILRDNGLLNEDPDAETNDTNFYNDLILDGDLIYAAALSAGSVDTFALDPVTKLPLEADPLGSTEVDPEAFPSGLTLRDGILYIAKAGHNRIDAHVINADGLPAGFPSSSTGSIDNSFPVDTEIFELP